MQLAVRSKAQHLLLSPRAPDLDSECRPFLSPAVPPCCSGLGSLSPSSVQGVERPWRRKLSRSATGRSLSPSCSEQARLRLWPPSLRYRHRKRKPAQPRRSVLVVCARCVAELTHPHRVFRQRGGSSQLPAGH